MEKQPVSSSVRASDSQASLEAGVLVGEVELDNVVSRRDWMQLGERVFSHPRYAVLLLFALGLCFFDRNLWIMVPLSLFFSVELGLRFMLQRESGWRSKTEILFLCFDTIATVSMILLLFSSISLVQYGIYVRAARFFRGLYMLRLLRVFRFLSADTLVYSQTFAMVGVFFTSDFTGVQVDSPHCRCDPDYGNNLQGFLSLQGCVEGSVTLCGVCLYRL